MTRTYATLEVSQAAFDEIAGKLREAGQDQCFASLREMIIDMHGIALTRAADLSCTDSLAWCPIHGTAGCPEPT